MEKHARKLVMENGAEFLGTSFGAVRETLCEMVFNTSMVGYQEIVTDPSYTEQMVVMTYPLIGNYGICDDDHETKTPTMGAMVVREYNDLPSNFRATQTLSQLLEAYGIPGIQGVDTRKIARMIRSEGSQKAILCAPELSREEALEKLRAYQLPHDTVSRVSGKQPWRSEAENAQYTVVCVDCGIKLNIIRELNKRGCTTITVPYDTTADEILAYKPDGLFLSNGPGDPEDVPTVIKAVQQLKGKLPIFGICLGHQMISLAYGAKTYKMKFGHRGGNHPVKDLRTGKIAVTSQNHSYAVDLDSLKETRLTLTHLNLLDHTAEGVECAEDKLFSIQYHPESAPGPQDSTHLFDKFTGLLAKEREQHA
ncbi:MAG TPA: glutamine-hydrolyzing carbamoyl-phosphate synthase small subunit [Candidatus Limiplasma sp.]|nr:glutamine-hydrolyzing carbamoyl-phosphate synthase small subunit [Candidatus Limiplasma sp.]HRX09249.1 glutamine-hydrolyzing carbamoyl-phosphate synthase small subunit [Candidatus Limiplasma sp.]